MCSDAVLDASALCPGGRPGLLMVAFGAASPQSEAALRFCNAELARRFGSLPVRWAFTSDTVRRNLAQTRRSKTDSVAKALQKMRFERYTRVVVQPLHVLPGLEFHSVCRDAAAESGPGFEVRVGQPLLASPAHLAAVAEAVAALPPPERRPQDGVVLMAHGSQHPSEHLYEKLQNALRERDPLMRIACMKGSLSLEQALDAFRSEGVSRLWLLPLLSLVGRHALEDMAGAQPGSWLSRIRAAGFDCETRVRGLTEDAGCVSLWLDRLEMALAGQSVKASPGA